MQLLPMGGGGLGPNSGELSEFAGGTSGRLIIFTTATPQELLDCNHSNAHDPKEKWKRGTKHIGVCVCVCVCACDAQFFQIMLKLRGSTMMRLNHEFWCSVALLCVCVCVCVCVKITLWKTECQSQDPLHTCFSALLQGECGGGGVLGKGNRHEERQPCSGIGSIQQRLGKCIFWYSFFFPCHDLALCFCLCSWVLSPNCKQQEQQDPVGWARHQGRSILRLQSRDDSGLIDPCLRPTWDGEKKVCGGGEGVKKAWEGLGAGVQGYPQIHTPKRSPRRTDYSEVCMTLTRKWSIPCDHASTNSQITNDRSSIHHMHQYQLSCLPQAGQRLLEPA